MSDLTQCPCCGSLTASLSMMPGSGAWGVVCGHCGASGPVVPLATQERAVEEWNAWALARAALQGEMK